MSANPERTRLSSKGQVVLPSAIRTANRWTPGTEFLVTSFGDGVLLTPLAATSPFPRTSVEAVFGSIEYRGPPLSIADMDRAVMAEARRRTGRNGD